MKNLKSLCAAAALLAGIASYAQQLRYGAKAGLNLTSARGEIQNTAATLGVHAGVFAEISIAKQLYVQPEILYSTEGVNTALYSTLNGTTIRADETLMLRYINVPLMVKYYPLSSLSAEAGPQVGFLLDAKSNFNFRATGGQTVNDAGSKNIRSNLHKFAVGINFGVGYELTDHIFVQGRYHMGLSDINKDYRPDLQGTLLGPARNSALQLAIGYKL